MKLVYAELAMAFAVEDFADLLRLLDEHPEWREDLRRRVLDDEFLRLPEYVRQNSLDIAQNSRDIAQNSADIRELKEVVAQNSRDIAQNSADIRSLRETIAETRAEFLVRFDEMDARFDRMDTRMDVMQRDIEVMKGDIGALKGYNAEAR